MGKTIPYHKNGEVCMGTREPVQRPTSPFSNVTVNHKDSLGQASIQVARSKEDRIREFFDNPYPNESPPWYLEQILFDYFRKFVQEGMKRKDGYTEESLHVIDPLLFNKILLQIGYLPDKVTKECRILKSTGAVRRNEIPTEQQSIRLLFATTIIHDLKEDYPKCNNEHLTNYINERLRTHPNLKEDHVTDLQKMIPALLEGLDAITFGYKDFDGSGNIIKTSTHGDDLQLYLNALQEKWFSIGAKAIDRLGGLVTRFSETESKFTIKDHIEYADQTRKLFMVRQTLENMADRYPEMRDYFEIINANIRIALVTLEAIAFHYPNLPKDFKQKGVSNPNTVEIDIHRFAPIAMKARHYTPSGICPMQRLVGGIQAEANRHPSLQPIVSQVTEQLQPYLNELGQNLRLITNPPTKKHI